jgi:hypothetical protein
MADLGGKPTFGPASNEPQSSTRVDLNSIIL